MWLATCLPLRDSNKDSWSPNTNLDFILSPPWVQLVQRAAWMLSTGTKRTQLGWDSEFEEQLLTIHSPSNLIFTCNGPCYLQLTPPDKNITAFSKFIIFVFHSCHGSKIYTQQSHCHFQLQMKLAVPSLVQQKKKCASTICQALC